MDNRLRVHRSLTIKQMATVTSVVLFVVSIFIITQLFHFVSQRRTEYAQQMENIAHTVRQPLSEAVLRADIPNAERILNALKPAGVLGRAEINLPDSFQALQVDFSEGDSVPPFVAKLFSLPVEISLPLYSPERTGLPRPLAYLVLEADSTRVYQFILSTVATMVITYLLLALVLSISISWFINRLIVHPLRHIARSLQELPYLDATAELPLPSGHRGDEIGVLVRGVNHRQRKIATLFEKREQAYHHDILLRLPNQHRFLVLLDKYLRQASAGAALMVIDFSLEGHAAAPEKLKRALAEKLYQSIEADAVLASLTEAGFAIFYQQGVQSPCLLYRARHYIDLLNQPLRIDHHDYQPQISIGLVYSQHLNGSASELFDAGRAALHHARQQGQNQAHFADSQMMAQQEQRLFQLQQMLQGIEKQQYALFLQPQIDMQTGQIIGAEALLRISDSQGDYSLPADFIATAEKLGVLPKVGRWVIEEACRILASWQAKGVMLPLSINLSAGQLQDTKTLAHLQAMLTAYRIHPATLVLELTETAQINDLQRIISLLTPIQKAGVSVVLDDFGTGYSNLHWLQQLRALPVRRIKLDQRFVGDLPSDDALVKVIASIAEIMELTVVAEGVENTLQRDWLLERGIHIAQGFLYSPALAEQQFNLQWLGHTTP